MERTATTEGVATAPPNLLWLWLSGRNPGGRDRPGAGSMRDFLFDYAPGIGMVVGSALAGLALSFVGKGAWVWPLFGVGTLLAVASTVREGMRKARVAELRHELAKLQKVHDQQGDRLRHSEESVQQLQQDLMRANGRLAASYDDRHRLRVEHALAELTEILGLDDSYRLTAFRHWREDRRFNNLGRGAAKAYWRQRNRISIPDDQGVLAEALTSDEGYAAVEDLPHPNLQREAYNARMRDMRLAEADIQGLTMRPRSIGAFPLPDHASGQPRYFLTIESKRPGALAEDGVVEALLGGKRHLLSHLESVLSGLKDDEPGPWFAG